jgi:hypothetical protein
MAEQCSVHRRRRRVVRRIRRREMRPVALAGLGGSREDCLCRGVTTPHGLGDAFALKRVHESCGVADQEHTTPSGPGADHPHLEPPAEDRCGGGAFEEAQVAQRVDERRQLTRGSRAAAP